LSSLEQASPKLYFETVVVDNGSSDDSLQRVHAGFPHVRLIANGDNAGFARANNQALLVCRARYYLLLNSDTVVHPQTLEEMVDVADRHPHVGVVGCKLLNADGTLQESWATFPTLWSELLGRNVRKRRPVQNAPGVYEVDWVGGACFLVRANAVAQVGLLDEDYFMYSEELDWCYRMQHAGWQIFYLASAAITHFGGGSASRASLAQRTRLYTSKILFFRKHYGFVSALLLRYGLVAATCFGLLRQLVFYQTSRETFVEQIRSYWDLIRFLLQMRSDLAAKKMKLL
jgi:GT2 family glycosyltransferase